MNSTFFAESRTAKILEQLSNCMFTSFLPRFTLRDTTVENFTILASSEEESSLVPCHCRSNSSVPRRTTRGFLWHRRRLRPEG